MFVNGKCFDEIVVDTGVQSCNAIVNVIISGQHQNAGMNTTHAHSLADIDAAEIRKMPVEND